ncbi:LysR substrate-binding domain-containing protein [Lysobacter sp. 2RAB21]
MLYTYSRFGNAWRFTHKRHGDFSISLPAPLRVNNAEALNPALLAGLGVALQPEFLVWRELRSGKLEAAMPEWSPPPIALRIDATGQVFWNNNPTPLTAIQGMMNETVQRDPTNQPLLEIDTNDDAEYGILARVLAYAKNADMKKIGFVQK